MANTASYITVREALIAGTHCQADRIDATNAIAIYRKGLEFFESFGMDIDVPVDEQTACEAADEFFDSIYHQI